MDQTRMEAGATAQWFDPTDGSFRPAAAPFKTPGKNASGDHDWVLVSTGREPSSAADLDPFEAGYVDSRYTDDRLIRGLGDPRNRQRQDTFVGSSGRTTPVLSGLVLLRAQASARKVRHLCMTKYVVWSRFGYGR